MIEASVKEALGKFKGYTEEQQLNFLSNLFTWAEIGKAKEKTEKALNDSLELHKEMIGMLKAENQKLKAAGGADPAVQAENQRLHAENEQLAAQVKTLEQQKGSNAAWEAEKAQYEVKVKNLMTEADTQRSRADKMTFDLKNEQDTSAQLAARVQELSSQMGQAGNWQEKFDEMQKKLDANVAAKRDLEKRLKDNEKKAKEYDGLKKKIAEQEDLVAKLKSERDALNKGGTKATEELTSRDEEIARLKAELKEIRKDSADRRALREMKATGIPGQRSMTVMPGVPGFNGSPKIGSDGVAAMYQIPQLGKGAQKELDALRQEVDALRSQLNVSEERYQALVKENESLRSGAPADGGNAALEDENAALRKQVSALEEQVKAAETQTGSSEELDALKAENKKQTGIIEGLRKEINDLNNAKDTLTVKIQQLEAAGDQTKALEDEKKKLNEKVKEMTEENAKLSARVKELEPQLEEYLKEQEAKKKAEEAARAAASSSYEMRVSTSTAEVEKHPDAKYLVTNSGFDGSVRISDNAPRKKAYFVMIDGKAFPNPYFFKELLTGKQSHNTLQQLRSLFDLEGLDNPQMTYRLVSVEPAQIYVPDQSKKAYEVKAKGKLKVEHLS